MQHAIDIVLTVIFTLIAFVFEAIGLIDGYLGRLMTSAGLPPAMQTALLIVLALLMVIFAVRLLGPIFVLLLIVLLLLLIVHRLLPGVQLPQMPHSGWVHI